MRRLAGFLFLVGCLMAGGGCLKPETAVQRGGREQVLHRGMGADPADLDPHVATTISELDVASALFAGLVAEDPIDLHPVPGVAMRSEISPDLLKYTCFLRPDAKWADGKSVTAEDFV